MKKSKAIPSDTTRLKLAIRGAVQGVGFRPFVFRLATELHLNGWVNNSAQGVFIEVDGPRAALETFLLRLDPEKPPRSSIHSLEASWLDAAGYTSFEIRPSETGGAKTALVLPDIATCPDCLREIFDPSNRRYLYPFTNCTNCGPRFSIIESLPYDRANTSMKRFTMCPQCQAEYDDPRDRRFHAQPNACPACGPRIEVWEMKRERESGKSEIRPASTAFRRGENPKAERRPKAEIEIAAEAVRAGRLVAVKGLGGFHLMVAAHDDTAVRRLRELKHREEKPFALMFPSLEAVKNICEVSTLEERLLRSPEAPIVLLRRHHASRTMPHGSSLAASIAPNNPILGVMLPYTPLHHLLLGLLNFPVVATSGNLSDEPICIDEHEAFERLPGIADLFLVHDRPIVRHVDDSIVRVMAGRELVLRRARGFAPLPIQLRPIGNRQLAIGNGVLAVGAHLKNTIALSVGSQAFISQHIGDLETSQAYDAFRRVIADFEKLYESSPATVAADAHPDYLSTKYAHELVAQASSPASPPGAQEASPHPGILNPAAQASSGSGSVQGSKFEVQRSKFSLSGTRLSASAPRLLTIQHHVAHVLSCMAENELQPPALGVSWDGTGYGLDGTVWGGEFFLVTETACERVAHLRQFRLPGGEQAVKEPRRTALGLLCECYGEEVFRMGDLAPLRAFSPRELSSLKTMLTSKLNSPLTSSAGRLFDAVASLLGVRQQVRFEGQAAMELEFALEGVGTDDTYPLPALDAAPLEAGPASPAPPSPLDWSPMLHSIVTDIRHQVPGGHISAKFHNTLAEIIVLAAQRFRQERVILSGGCFQNRYLTERTVQRLQAEGFRPYWHQRVPPNDGGIALGQIVAAHREQAKSKL